MCNFVRRECIAFGRLEDMQNLVADWVIPGVVQSIRLLPEGTSYEPFDNFGFLHVTNIPEGLEILAVSKLSAALAPMIGKHAAVAELNGYIPFTAAQTNGREPFSPVAQNAISKLKTAIEKMPHESRPVAVLDSGFDPDALQLHEDQSHPNIRFSTRKVTALDYTNENIPEIVAPHGIADHETHGSVVCRILDAILPYDVPLAVGRIARGRSDVTVLYLARCYAHIVATQLPKVVNLSLAPLRDHVFCPHCNEPVPIDGFHSLILPRVFELAAHTTWTVMAAGNEGKACDADHYLADARKLIYATAVDSSGRPAAYSNYISGKKARTLAAFGGDPAHIEGGQGLLTGEDRVAGTSFAAPFVCAAIWASSQGNGLESAALDYSRTILA